LFPHRRQRRPRRCHLGCALILFGCGSAALGKEAQRRQERKAKSDKDKSNLDGEDGTDDIEIDPLDEDLADILNYPLKMAPCGYNASSSQIQFFGSGGYEGSESRWSFSVILTNAYGAASTAVPYPLDLNVKVELTDFGASLGADYGGPPSFTVRIPGGFTSPDEPHYGTASIPLLIDDQLEPFEKFKVTTSIVEYPICGTQTYELGITDMTIVAVDDHVLVPLNTLTFLPNLTANDQVTTPANKIIESFTQPEHGSVAWSVYPFPSLVYTPETGYIGDDSFTYTVIRGVPPNYSRSTAEVHLHVGWKLDLDNDANNDDQITEDDEIVEEYPPGQFVLLNTDDDNGNQTPDWDETDAIEGEDDLVPFNIEWEIGSGPGWDAYNGWHVVLQANADTDIEIWSNPDKTGPISFEETVQGAIYDWTVGQEEPPSVLYLEAGASGTAMLSLNLFGPNWIPSLHPTPTDQDTIYFTFAPIGAEIDLDTDSDNSGTIDGTAAEEADELLEPGKIIARNIDDDNANGRRDYLDQAWFVTPAGLLVPNGDDELQPLQLTVPAGLAGYRVSFIADSNVRLWMSKDKGEDAQVPGTLIIGPQLPTTIYAEGLIGGQARVTMTLRPPAGQGSQPIARDTVLLTVVDFDAVAYRPQTAPFAPFPVPESEEGSGVGIRRNLDDDDGLDGPDGNPADAIVTGENDLIRVDLNRTPLAQPVI
jgi:hypothetical protein